MLTRLLDSKAAFYGAIVLIVATLVGGAIYFGSLIGAAHDQDLVVKMRPLASDPTGTQCEVVTVRGEGLFEMTTNEVFAYAEAHPQHKVGSESYTKTCASVDLSDY